MERAHAKAMWWVERGGKADEAGSQKTKQSMVEKGGDRGQQVPD